MSISESDATLHQVAGAPRFVQKYSRRRAARVASAIRLCSLWALAGCDTQAQERAEARELLAQLTAASEESSLSERSAALAALGKLRLRTPALIAMRDACRAAHQGLLEAETAQASARKALAEAGANQGAGTRLSPSQADAIHVDIERSNRSLSEAKSRFPTCERAMRELTTKAH
jgi:hypothetical protein